ncbi:secreted protein [methanotrophic bacterial endosymbiont of Bathymodiolus sp.]|nr:secreted protein [methanotrophic bacterial endosymbiont of Bathymodiolus sp.]
MLNFVKALIFLCVSLLLLILPGNFSQWNYQKSWYGTASSTLQLSPAERNWLDKHHLFKLHLMVIFRPIAILMNQEN